MNDSNDGSQQPKSIASVLKDLQPIRDLAKNWDIDIATCLEEYLHELGHGEHLGDASMQDSQDEVLVKANFAQAALLLHNSSNVYSRKVEYLYSLVCQQLDSLLSTNAQKRTARGRSTDPELEEFREFDPHQEFLLLDDVLPTDKTEDCRHINLPQSPMDRERRISAASSGLATPHGNISMRTQNLSGSTMGKSFHTLGVSKTLSQINTQSSAVLRLMDGQCDLDPSGRLLIPGSQSNSTSSHTTPQSVNANTDSPGFAANGDYDGDGNDDDDDGPGYMMTDDDSVGGNGNDGIEGMQAPPTTKKRVTFAVDAEPVVEVVRPDPWALLDPHSSDTRKSRSLKLGKTLRLPPSLDDLPSDCVSGSHTRKWKEVPEQVKQQSPVIPKFYATETFQALSRKRRLDDDEETVDEQGDVEDDPAVIPLKGLLYGEEFAYLAREHAKRKAAERRLLRRTREQERAKQPTQNGEEPEQMGNNFDDDDDDYGGGYAFGDDDDDNYDVGPEDNGATSPIVETNTGLQAVEEAYGDRQEGDTESMVDARSFEDLCRAHIAKFAKGAEKYASETQLTQRVDQWQEKLEPLLAEEEKRPEFDIHEYGRSVLGSVGTALEREKTDSTMDDETLQVVNFAEVTKECPNYQVCRYFLASLCLCNTGNVVLEQPGGSTNNLSVKLLSVDYSRPMETYQAPSAVEQTM